MIFSITRLHSSRMHTARLLTSISQHVLRRGGLPGGCLPRGLSYQGMSTQRMPPQGGGLSWGVYHVTYPIMHLMLPLCCPGHQLRLIISVAAYIVFGHVTCGAYWDTTLPMDRMTDTCKNITFSNCKNKTLTHATAEQSRISRKHPIVRAERRQGGPNANQHEGGVVYLQMIRPFPVTHPPARHTPYCVGDTSKIPNRTM